MFVTKRWPEPVWVDQNELAHAKAAQIFSERIPTPPSPMMATRQFPRMAWPDAPKSLT